MPPLTTGTNPHLTVAEEATLAVWQAGTAAMTERLAGISGLRLDRTPRRAPR